MSLLSQFFPSGGGGGGGIAQKIEILMVGGGGGGGASGGNCIHAPSQTIGWGSIGGGGGGGQVVFSDGYEVIQDVSYPITVGAGGAGGGFFYDTTNVYCPSPVSLPESYREELRCHNAGTLRGANGGNTVFGSVIAYGGGGGGGGWSSTDSYLPTPCANAAFVTTPTWTARGADGGTGGGSGSGYYDIHCDVGLVEVSCSPDVRPGKTLRNASVQFLKFGTDGTKFKLPVYWTGLNDSPQPALNSSSILTYATGGGGNSGGDGCPVFGAGICLVTPCYALTCFKDPDALCRRIDASTGCQQASGAYVTGEPNTCVAVNAFMEGSIGNTNSKCNAYSECSDLFSSLRGGDGYLTNITPSPEYYGGGGGVAYSVVDENFSDDCVGLFGAVFSPGHPCFPSPLWINNPLYAWTTCPYGGQGGGGSVSSSQATAFRASVRYPIVCTGNLSFSTGNVGYCCSLCGPGPIPVPGCICPGAGVANCGGGGASFYGGCIYTSTGDVFPNPTNDAAGADTCAFCGYAGGSGTVVIRYPTAYCAATVTGNTPITPQSGYHVYRFNGPGTITFPSS